MRRSRMFLASAARLRAAFPFRESCYHWLVKINRNYFDAIKPILEKLGDRVDGEFVVFGSAPLYLLGILEFKGLDKIHDLDVTLDGSLGRKDGFRVVHFENDPNKPLYKITINGVDVDVGTKWPGHEDWFKRVFSDPIIVDGFKFANLQTVLDFKKMNIAKYNREKDKDVVARIEEYLEGCELHS